MVYFVKNTDFSWFEFLGMPISNLKITSENNISEQLVKLKLDTMKIERLPEIVQALSKPMEKIDSIRINQITGLNTGGSGESVSPYADAMQSILGMAVQFPAMKKLGEEIGLDFDGNLATRVNDSMMRSNSRNPSEAKALDKSKSKKTDKS